MADVGPYADDVARTLERDPKSLFFPRRLEQLFERETEHERSAHLVGVGILWIALGILSALVLPGANDGPTPFGMDPAVRLGLVTPFLIAVIYAVWWGVRPFVRELLMTLACIVAPASMMLMVIMSPGLDMASNRGALTIILLFITVVVRLRFWFAAAACLALVGMQSVLPLAMDTPVPGNPLLGVITIMATLTANYSLEREYRRNYLQSLNARIQGAQLNALVEQLRGLSHQDALTGLANRRAMDVLLEDLSARRLPYAMILVDIDGFKAFNDCYGHQVGDDCLRRVAAMLRASLRFTDDRIARMGGEEFAVVLPRTALEDARTMAERMRRSILELQIPHLHSPTGHVVSISAGVSASPGDKRSIDVVADADRALYRAKSGGRNRVQIATAAVAEPVARTADEPAALAQTLP
jgi:diguanylate cyclase (GGDEF)-like protein